MVKKKLVRFAENFTFGHLFQQSYADLLQGFPLKGRWKTDYFRNDHPIVLELGCGKGEYTVNLANDDPSRNFIGIDIKGARMWRGCRMVKDLGLKNVAFIRTKIELIGYFFDAGEVDEIWITFPDPHPTHRRLRRRLTSPIFIRRYLKILRPGGRIHLKTDNEQLFDFTLDMIKEMGHQLIMAERDLYGSGYEGEATQIRTFYEEMFCKEGMTIKYLQFIPRHE